MGDQTPRGLTESRSFPLRPGSAAKVRAFLVEATRLDSMKGAEAALLATELIANAVQHAEAKMVMVSVERKDLAVRIGVGHQADHPLGEVTPGFGLHIVESVAQAWGSDFDAGVLTVWFEIRSPGAVSMSPADLGDDELFERVGEHPIYAEELVKRHEPLALSIARRYRGKGIGDDDLDQVARIALMKAIHRFDATRGELKPFAAVTISGELKRQLRDRGWSLRVPRGLQERAMAVTRTGQELSQASGGVPKLSEIAAALDLEEEDVAEAMSVGHGYRALSLDEPDRKTGTALIDMLGEADPSLGEMTVRAAIDDALRRLPERERTIVYLRFYEDMTQSQIAERVGVSQMQVSRLLTKTLSDLADILSVDG